MSLFIKSLQLAAPLLILTAIGYLLRKIDIIDKPSSIKISKLVLNVILPISLFNYIYNSDLRASFDIKLVIFLVVSILLAFIVSIFVFQIICKDTKKLPVLIQSAFWGNYSIFGLPLAVAIAGDVIASEYTLAITLISPLTNLCSIMIFEHYKRSDDSLLSEILQVLKSPMLICIVAALIINLCNITLPAVIVQTLKYIGDATTGLSLINLGAGFNLKINKSVIKYIGLAILIKLFITPGIMIPVGTLLGFSGLKLIIIFVIAAAPIAASAYSMAASYDVDIEMASSAIVYSYILCAITIPAILSIITYLGLV